MESNIQPNQSKDRTLFTSYLDIQDILMNPLKPLVHFIGFQNTHQTIIQLTLEGPQVKDSKNFKQYSIQSYEFYDQSKDNQPLIYTTMSKGDKVATQDLGFLKYSFFKSLVMFKPAVTVIVFDWQSQTDTNYDWKIYEAQVLAEVKQHQERCTGARQSKIVLLIFLPLNDTSSVDEKITSLKRAVASRGDDNIKTFFLLTTGFEGLKNIAKKFVKNINDLCYQYYREKKFAIKKKQKKLIKEQIENIRYSFKHGLYSSYTKADYKKPIQYLKEAYNQLRQSVGNSGAKTSFDEKRENADLMTIKICQIYISNDNYQGFIEQFRSHFYTFQTRISLLRKEQRYEELKWRANQMRIMSQFLEMFPTNIHDGEQEFFSGYYSLNCMLLLIARKQEYERLAREKGDALFNEQEMSSLITRQHNLIGRELILQDTRDPLGGAMKPSADTKSILEKFKIYQEAKHDLNSIVLEYAQKSIQQYKSKSRQSKGHSSAMYKRMIQFITYHISEYVLASQQNTSSKTQKYRGSIAQALIQEGWIQEALNFVEKAKSTISQNIQDFFSYEMQVLNYDRVIKPDERNKRFIELIEKVKREEIEDPNEKPLNLIGPLVGPQLIWSRAKFDLKIIQVNQYNKLKVEIQSKVDQSIKIKKITLRFNENPLDQEIEGDFELSRSKSIILDRELYISKDNAQQRNVIQLNEILLEIQKGSVPDNEGKVKHDLAFLIRPYLYPEDDLIELNERKRKPVRIKEPIQFNIEAMPSKVHFGFEFDENLDQALLGDYYNVIISLEPEDITISEMTLKIENVETENIALADSQMDQQNLMGSDEQHKSGSSTNVTMSSVFTTQRTVNVRRENSGNMLLQKQNSISNDMPSLAHSNSSGLPPFSKPKAQIFKDIEIFYQIDPQCQINDCDQENNKLQELDYLLDDNILQIPTNCRKIRLAFKCYQEANNSVNLLFRYSFTQNSDKEDQKQLMKQQFKKQLKIKSQSPFKIDWEIKNSDSYIQTLKLRNENLQLSPMLAPIDEECWVTCNLTSQSTSKILYLNDVQLDILEKAKIMKVQQVDLGDNMGIRLEPNESFESIFKIKVQNEASENAKPKLLREIDNFGELQFSWYSQNSSNENIIDSMLNQDQIQCSIPAPTMTIVDVPLKLKVLDEDHLQKSQLYKPLGLDVEIVNQSENVIEAEVSVEESDDFYIGGELKSLVTFMPLEKYNFSYNLIPLQIGRLSLPKFNISDISEPEKPITLIKGFTKKCLIVK